MAGPLQAPRQADRSPYEGGGCGGGKLRSWRAAGAGAVAAAVSSGVRRSTPYERPSSGRHASAGPQAAAQLTSEAKAAAAVTAKGLWLGGGLVTSASRILTRGASYLLSSLFGHRSIDNATANHRSFDNATADPVADSGEELPSNILKSIEAMLKRQSIVLDNGGTLAGPVRRTRIKTNCLTSHGILASGRVSGVRPSSITSRPPVAVLASSRLKRSNGLASDTGKILIDNHSVHEKGYEINLPDGLAFVPAQSSRTAQRILETLERLSPSPKGKSVDEELALVRERSPTGLSPSMLNKKAQRTMQGIEALIEPDFHKATWVKDMRNEPSEQGLYANPSKLATQVKGNENSEGTKVDEVAVMPLCAIIGASEDNGLEASVPAARGTHSPQSNQSKVPDLSTYERSKRKGFRISADCEGQISEDEGNVSTRAPFSNSIRAKSSISVGSGSIPFSLTTTVTSISNLSSLSKAPSNFNAKPILEASTSHSLVTTITATTTSISEAPPSLTCGFAFPFSSQLGANLEPPLTRKSILSDTPSLTPTPVPMFLDPKVSSTFTTPVSTFLTGSSAEQSDLKKGSLLSIPSRTSQEQFGAKPLRNSSSSNVASTSMFSQSFSKVQSTSGSITSALISKTSTSAGSSSSFVSTSGFGSSFSAPSFPPFSFSGVSSSSSLTSLSVKSDSASSIIFGSAVRSSSSTSAQAIFSAGISAAGWVFSTAALSSVFSASSSLAVTPSSETSRAASLSMYGPVCFGQGSTTSSRQSAPTASPIFGATSGCTFGLSNAAPVFSGNMSISAANSSMPAFGTPSTKPSGNFGQDAMSCSSSAGNTFGAGFGALAPASMGFSCTSSSAASAAAFSFSSTAASSSSVTSILFGASSGVTENPFSFGARKPPIFQPQPVFGNMTPATSSLMSTDSNEQTMMEDRMVEEPSQITPSPSQLGTYTPPAGLPFTFGAPNIAQSPGQGVFALGAEPTPVPNAFITPARNLFAQPSQSGGVNFAGGFAPGFGGERAGRKFIRAKRTGVKQGK